MSIEDIDGVIARLNQIGDAAEAAGTRDGYFAVLYERMTRAIRDHITGGTFDDGPRMERLDVSFANRYFDAFDAHGAGKPLTDSWRHAFDSGQRRCPLVFQHLLLGINAHINLDLGIATASVVGPEGIAGVEQDFMRVNAILRSLIDVVQDGIGRFSPAFKPLDWALGAADEEWFSWELEKARDSAWRLARELAGTPPERWDARIKQVDAEVTQRGARILFPGWFAATCIGAVGLLESRRIKQNIRMLRQAVA